MERGNRIRRGDLYTYICSVGGMDAINIVVGTTVCVSKTKRVADKELWGRFSKKKKPDKKFTFRYGRFVVVKSFAGHVVSVTGEEGRGQ